MLSRGQRRPSFSPSRWGWWSRLCPAIVVAFYLNYIPIHLATAAHLDDLFVAVAHSVFHHHGPDQDDHGTGHDVPHPASDHALSIVAQKDTASGFVPTLGHFNDTPVIFVEPRFPSSHFLERIQLPGESPPGLLLPRAPPLA